MDIKFQCVNCGADFVVATETFRRFGLNDLPKRCPACHDVGSALASAGSPVGTVVSRRCIGSWPCLWISTQITGRLQPVETHRDIVGRAVFCGRDDFEGVEWYGRLDVWDHRRAASDGYAAVRLMVAEKVVGVTGRGTAVWSPTSELSPEVVGQRVQSYRYLVLGEARGDGAEPDRQPIPNGMLVVAARRWKTTLKGLGRQEASRFVISEGVTEIARYGAQCRTGRFGGEGIVAVVPDGDFIAVASRCDGSSEEYLLWASGSDGYPADDLPGLGPEEEVAQ